MDPAKSTSLVNRTVLKTVGEQHEDVFKKRCKDKINSVRRHNMYLQ